MTHVEGSGTGLARREPMFMLSSDGSYVSLPDDDTRDALPNQPPPRSIQRAD